MEGEGEGRGGGGILINFYSLFVSSDPMVAYPEIKVQVRDLMRVVGIVAPVAPRGFVFEESRLIEPHWITEHSRPVPGAPSSGTPLESQAKFRGGSVWGL